MVPAGACMQGLGAMSIAAACVRTHIDVLGVSFEVAAACLQLGANP